MRGRTFVWISLLALSVTGCASVNLSRGFSEVGATVEERAAAKIAWNERMDLDDEAAARLRTLLQGKLTAEDVLQIALLNNRGLQAMYSDLGVAEADLVQAGLLRNPVFDAAVAFSLGTGRPDLQLGLVFGVLDALYVPLRKRVAAAQFEEAKLRLTGVVLDFVLETRHAFHGYQADEQILELRRTVVQALEASVEVSRRLHAAGNITDLAFARDRAALARSKLDLRSAEVAARQSRERLNGIMGLSGEQTAWEIDERLPEVPAVSLPIDDAERRAIARSLDLDHARQRIVVAGQQSGYDRAVALIPSLDLGAGAEKEPDEAWKVGPSVSVAFPIFDQGQARVARGAAELRRAQLEYYALAVRIRATARALVDRVRGAGDRAAYFRDIVLPLQERIVTEAQLQYNAMQLGIFELLRDRQQQIESGVEYVTALREYWTARADLLHLLSGRLPKTKENANGE
ncbi:MAG TPA: TolC family protein [Terriglobales bacterium]|nr:TolC family protein [Terriglobales bacterium]